MYIEEVTLYSCLESSLKFSEETQTDLGQSLTSWGYSTKQALHKFYLKYIKNISNLYVSPSSVYSKSMPYKSQSLFQRPRKRKHSIQLFFPFWEGNIVIKAFCLMPAQYVLSRVGTPPKENIPSESTAASHARRYIMGGEHVCTSLWRLPTHKTDTS